MTATTVTPIAPVLDRQGPFGRITIAVHDTVAIARRNVIAYRRVPQLLVFSTIQPIVFVLMFRYVFGGAISVPGVDYVDFLMPGIFVQTVVFGSMAAAIGLATDLKLGLIERFRSLPMARSAVLAGRTLADLVRHVFVVALMVVVGFAVGFRVHTNAAAFFAAMLLILLFGYAFAWVFATVGLFVGDAETAQAASFPVMAPLVFASTAFVPLDRCRAGCKCSPSTSRSRRRSTPSGRSVSVGRPLTNVIQAIAWCVGILAVAAPLAVHRYRRTV